MIKNIFWSVLAVAVSLTAALALVVAIEWVSAVIHPVPPGMDPLDKAACTAFFVGYPQWLFAVAALAWGLTAFASSWLATRLGTARHFLHGVSVGSLLLIAAGFNMFMLPYPIWFELANLLLLPLGIFVGTWLAMEPKDGPATGEVDDSPGN